VKKGEHGAILFHPQGLALVPAFPVDEAHVVDPTGAGDSFAGGFMAHIARKGSTDFATLQSAMGYGTVVASFALESFGLDRMRSLQPAEVQKRFEEFQRSVRIG